MKKIGILGGTFNPVHIGHLAIAQTAMDQCGLDEVIFVPCWLPPHKQAQSLAPAKSRLEMVKRAVKGHADFLVSDFEIQKKGKSYSIDTVRYFTQQFSEKTRLYFIIGGDSLETLKDWKDIDQLRRLVTFIAVNRPGFKAKRAAIRHRNVTMPGIDISSSYIRRLLRQGKSIKYLVPEPVFRYIKERNLYKKSTQSKRGLTNGRKTKQRN